MSLYQATIAKEHQYSVEYLSQFAEVEQVKYHDLDETEQSFHAHQHGEIAYASHADALPQNPNEAILRQLLGV